MPRTFLLRSRILVPRTRLFTESFTKTSEMEELPGELCLRIFALLDYRHLASAALVCRSWNGHSGQADLWQRLYVQRWGEERAAFFSHGKYKSWKEAYETQDRCDRVGLDMTITREGSDYFMVHKGEILRFLGSCKRRLWQENTSSQQELSKSISYEKELMEPIVQSDGRDCTTQEAESPGPLSNEDMISGGRVKHVGSCEGLLDKFLFFIGDLECAIREPKRNRVF